MVLDVVIALQHWDTVTLDWHHYQDRSKTIVISALNSIYKELFFLLVSNENTFGLIMRVSARVYNVMILGRYWLTTIMLNEIRQDHLLCNNPSILFSTSSRARCE